MSWRSRRRPEVGRWRSSRSADAAGAWGVGRARRLECLLEHLPHVVARQAFQVADDARTLMRGQELGHMVGQLSLGRRRIGRGHDPGRDPFAEIWIWLA